MNTISLKLFLPDFSLNTQFGKLPVEIIEYIVYQFIMIPTHKDIMSTSFKNIRFLGVSKRINYINNHISPYHALNYPLEYTICDLIRKYINDPEYIVKILSTCTCCSRHQNARPTSLDYNPFTFINDDDVSSSMNDYYNCRCPCRHQSRLIITTFTAYNIYY